MQPDRPQPAESDVTTTVSLARGVLEQIRRVDVCLSVRFILMQNMLIDRERGRALQRQKKSLI